MTTTLDAGRMRELRADLDRKPGLREQAALYYRINRLNLKAQTAYHSEFVLGLLFGLVWQGSMVLFAGVLLLRFPGLVRLLRSAAAVPGHAQRAVVAVHRPHAGEPVRRRPGGSGAVDRRAGTADRFDLAARGRPRHRAGRLR